jgi:mono/diheme cytochrome c family protein
MKRIIFALIACLSISMASFQKKPAFDLKASTKRGQEVYVTYCISCHMEKGEGLEGVYPPLAKSDYLMADKKRSIVQILKGAKGPMKVNKISYDAEMQGFDLNDQEVSDVLNYVRNSFGNKGVAVTPEEVRVAKK